MMRRLPGKPGMQRNNYPPSKSESRKESAVCR
jgi:hypothetical protein